MSRQLLDRTVAGGTESLVVFTLDEQLYGLRLDVVERVVSACWVAPIPMAPEIVLGAINMRGQVIPVVNTRRRLGLAERELGISDQFVIVRTSQRRFALAVDTVREVFELSGADVVPSAEILPGLEHIEGIARLPGGLILVHDVTRFLSLDEETALAEAMRPKGDSP